MHAFQTALKPSRLMTGAAVLLHFAAAAVCLTAFYGAVRPAGLLLLALSLFHALRILRLKRADALLCIEVGRQGGVRLRCADGSQHDAVLLREMSRTGARALFLTFRTPSGRILRQTVFADSTDSESFRRLKVWADWGGHGKEAV